MTDGLKVTIGGLEFYGQGAEQPFIIEPEGFEGWDDGVDMRLENTGRPQQHGSFDEPGFMDARTVSLSGWAFADGPRELAALQRRFTGLLAGGQRDRIQVEKHGEIMWAYCRRAAKPMFTEHGGLNYADYQIQVWCADPRKFGRERTFTAATQAPVEVHHRGNFDATPVVTITGNMPSGYTLTFDGWNYAVPNPLVPGAVHTIDYDTGVFEINGVVTENTAGETHLTTVPAGKHVGLGLYGPGTGTAAMTVTDTYV